MVMTFVQVPYDRKYKNNIMTYEKNTLSIILFTVSNSL